ncbi:hypothetical protein [Nocardia thraciensis]
MDGLQRRIWMALNRANDDLDPADARMLARRVLDLRAEVDSSDYGRTERLRLISSCSEVLAATRWALGRPGTAPLSWRVAV